MIEVLKILFSVGGSLVLGQVEKASIENKQKKQMTKMQAETESYIDESMKELYEKIEDKFSREIKNLIIVSRFLLVSFATILVLLIVLIVLFALKN